MDEKDYTANQAIGLFLLGVLLGGLASGFMFWGVGNNKDIEQLGKSICEEEYGMDYESYYNEVLRCKPFKERYDGIQVEVPKGTQT